MLRKLTSLLLVGLFLLSGCASNKPKTHEEILKLSDKDIRDMSAMLNSGKIWNLSRGSAAACSAGLCSVSCGPVPVSAKGEIGNDRGTCWAYFRSAHLVEYLKLMDEARRNGKPQRDAIGLAVCWANGCELKMEVPDIPVAAPAGAP